MSAQRPKFSTLACSAPVGPFEVVAGLFGRFSIGLAAASLPLATVASGLVLMRGAREFPVQVPGLLGLAGLLVAIAGLVLAGLKPRGLEPVCVAGLVLNALSCLMCAVLMVSGAVG